jgi:hypothetical protein
MRTSLIALFLLAGTASFGQSSVPAAVNPDELLQIPSAYTHQAADFSKLPEQWKNADFGSRLWASPSRVELPRHSNALADPGFVIHPPKSSIGAIPPGVPVAQERYPNLQFLRIDSASATVQGIPTKWPKLKLQGIPAQWPKNELLPVEGGASALVIAPAK